MKHIQGELIVLAVRTSPLEVRPVEAALARVAVHVVQHAVMNSPLRSIGRQRKDKPAPKAGYGIVWEDASWLAVKLLRASLKTEGVDRRLRALVADAKAKGRSDPRFPEQILDLEVVVPGGKLVGRPRRAEIRRPEWGRPGVVAYRPPPAPRRTSEPG